MEKKNFLERFLSENTPKYKLLRTIVQGVIGAIISNLDVILGTFTIPPALKPVITMLTMAVLSPIMAWLGSEADE